MKRNNKHFNIPDSKIQNKKFVFTLVKEEMEELIFLKNKEGKRKWQIKK